MKDIDWSKQHCGVRNASFNELSVLMPDLRCIKDTFPEDVNDFMWDVKVHMLMPGQFPCIPNWHEDNVPRMSNNEKIYEDCQLDKPMYLWLSGLPLTEFKDKNKFVIPQKWFRFTQADIHRGTISRAHQWRGFIRATHKDIAPPRRLSHDAYRRHSQVYLDSKNFNW